MLYDTHMHTPLCKHAEGDPGEYAQVAADRGLTGLIFTCHNAMPDGYSASVRMSVDQWDDYVQLIRQTTDAWRGRVDVRLGLECDYVPGYETWIEHQLAGQPLHYVLGSVHPQVGEYRARYWQGDALAYQQLYFDHLATAAETGLFDCLSHPDLVKNVTATEWDPDRISPAVNRALDRIARTGVAMELNTSGWNKLIPEANPHPQMLVEMAKRGIPVVIGSDAHTPERVGDRFEEAMDLLAQAGHENIHFFLDRKIQTIAIADARRGLITADPSG